MKCIDMMNSRPVILFDGYCNLCNGALNFVIKRDKKNLFRYIPLQSEQGAALMAEIPISKQQEDSIVYLEGENIYMHSIAILKIFSRLGGKWRFMMVFRLVPAVIRDYFYRIIARNRVKWFGRSESCRFIIGQDDKSFK